jgi:hypothetical protein
MTPHFDLVILIDCWPINEAWLEEEFHNETTQFYERIVHRLSEYDFKNVALASYRRPDDVSGLTATGITATSSAILDNVQSCNHGNDLKIKYCENMVEVFREFPEVCHSGINSSNTPNSVNILICGQAFQVCTHWRPLGFINWIHQDQRVFTHPDLVWRQGQEAIDQHALKDDPFIQWNELLSDSFASWSVGTGNDYIESPCFWADSLKWDNANEHPPKQSAYFKKT